MLPRFITCHNDVIDAGQNNQLFAPGTDMDRERLRLSHMQKGTYYVHICDNILILLNLDMVSMWCHINIAKSSYDVHAVSYAYWKI